MLGHGYLHEKPKFLDHFKELVKVGSASTKLEHPLFKYWFTPLNQHGTNSCVNCFVTQAVELRAKYEGLDIPELSILDLYAWARRKRGGAEAIDRDDGAFVSDVVWAFNEFGPSCDEFWPSRNVGKSALNALVRQTPSHLAISNAHYNRRRLKLRLRRILAAGKGLESQIVSALANYQPVGVAIPVGPEFERGLFLTGEQEGPYHMVTLLDWEDEGAEKYFLVGNSWGDSWGLRGMQWVRGSLIRQSVASYKIEKVGR